MSLNSTTSSERVHIAFFGKRNAGKSSLVNAVTGQKVSVVSEVYGTTTDPVKKAMELLPLGPVEIIDTPGYDDEGTLGELRVQRTKEVLRRTDLAVLAVDGQIGISSEDRELETLFLDRKIPYVIALTKQDLSESSAPVSGMAASDTSAGNTVPVVRTSALENTGITELKETLAHLIQRDGGKILLKDLLQPGDPVILVMPQDAAAPKGRLILPQQMMIREILDARAIPIGCQTEELDDTLALLQRKPALVITDSQAFKEVAPRVPEDVLLTGFSILFARYKGELDQLMGGVAKLAELKRQAEGGDLIRQPRILISEGCTHHRQCGDIGTVKLPALVRKFTGTDPEFTFTSGGEFPEDLKSYDLVLHCGACMLNAKEMQGRLQIMERAGVPVVNYGIAIAYMRGILKRSLELFPDMDLSKL